MAIRKASNSGLAGTKYNDASAQTTKIPDVPDTPTLGAASESAGVINLVVTPSATGGTPASYTVTSDPGGIVSNSNNTTVSFSNLTVGTSYTFSARSVNATATSGASSSTPSFTVPGYQFAQTFNSSGSYTVPSGKSFLAITGVGAGGSNGGAGGALFIIEDIPVTAGASYNITIAAGGGTNSTFGNILTVGSNGGNSTTNAGTFKSQQAGAAAGNNGAAGNYYNPTFTAGQAGASATERTSGNAQIGNYLAGGGGGGHGGTNGSAFFFAGALENGPLMGGGAGGSLYGGYGGTGAAGGQGKPNYALPVGPGGNANGPGGGGGRPSGTGGTAQFNLWIR